MGAVTTGGGIGEVAGGQRWSGGGPLRRLATAAALCAAAVYVTLLIAVTWNGRSLVASATRLPGMAVPRYVPHTLAWFSDGRRYLEEGIDDRPWSRQYSGVEFHSLDRPDVRGVHVAVPPRAVSLLRITADGRLLTTDDDFAAPQSRLRVSEMAVFGDPGAAHVHTLRLRDGAKIIDAAVDPAGRRIALLAESWRASTLAEFLARHFPRLGIRAAAQRCEELWAAPLDGGRFRFVRQQAITDAATVSRLRWSQDGRQIVFDYAGQSYGIGP